MGNRTDSGNGAVFAQNNDTEQLALMFDCSDEVLQLSIDTVHVDAGYCSVPELHGCQVRDVDLFALVADRSTIKRKESQDGGEHGRPR